MPELADKKEACKTYVEQTKLLVTLASGFILAPPAALALLNGQNDVSLGAGQISHLLWAEISFVVSVLLGYFTLGTIVGSQDEGTYDVYRFATMAFSWAQILAYVAGLGLLVWLIYDLS